jgi:hypothetical protein
MSKSNKFSPEVRERAVRMLQEHRGEYPSLWAANHHRLLEPISYIPPAEAEANYYPQFASQNTKVVA